MGNTNGDVNFIILGMTGSGKTCFLTGMYYEMSAGIEGYTLSADDEIDVELRYKWEKLCDEKSGIERFPIGTDQTENYHFILEYSYKRIKEFNWLDYPGGDLEKKNMGNLDSYKEIEKAILKSECLYICVDGQLLCEDNKEKMIENVRNKCSSKINGFISKYIRENKYIPPVAIILTKYDMCQRVKSEIIEDVIKQAFSSLFVKDKDKSKIVTLIPVSIGKNIVDDNYSGRLEPINIHIPLFWGIWFSVRKDLQQDEKKKSNLEKSVFKLNDEICKAERGIIKFLRKKKIKNMKNDLSGQKKELEEIKNNIEKQYEYVEKIEHQLKNIDVYIGGDKLQIEDIKI